MSNANSAAEALLSLIGNAVITQVYTRVKAAEAELSRQYVEYLKEGFKEGIKKCSKIYDAQLHIMFDEAVDEFYLSYTPKRYKRRYGLYDVEDFYVNEDLSIVGKGEIAEDTISLFNEELMHEDRSGGNSLYETVFLEGYHGGAKYGEDHLNPGVAWWRLPRIKGRRGWYKSAFQTESPYEIFEEKYIAREGEFQDKFLKIVQKSVSEYEDKFAKVAPKILKELIKKM